MVGGLQVTGMGGGRSISPVRSSLGITTKKIQLDGTGNLFNRIVIGLHFLGAGGFYGYW
jgi:hypothetical protein